MGKFQPEMEQAHMLPTPFNFEEKRTEVRRTQILMGAAQVFAEKGFHKATTREIAEAAGISQGTIYNYFNNKRELLLAMIELIAAQSLRDLITSRPPDNPREFFTAILRDRFQLLQARGNLLAPILAEVFTDAELRREAYQQIARPLVAHLEQYLRTHIDSGRFRNIDPLIVTRAFIGAMLINFALKVSHLDHRYEEVSADVLIEQLVSLFLEGLLYNRLP